MAHVEDIFQQVDNTRVMQPSDWNGMEPIPEHYKDHNALPGRGDPRLQPVNTPIQGLRQHLRSAQKSPASTTAKAVTPPNPQPAVARAATPPLRASTHWTQRRAESPSPVPGRTLWSQTGRVGLPGSASTRGSSPIGFDPRTPATVTRNWEPSVTEVRFPTRRDGRWDRQPVGDAGVNFSNYAAGDDGAVALAEALATVQDRGSPKRRANDLARARPSSIRALHHSESEPALACTTGNIGDHLARSSSSQFLTPTVDTAPFVPATPRGHEFRSRMIYTPVATVQPPVAVWGTPHASSRGANEASALATPTGSGGTAEAKLPALPGASTRTRGFHAALRDSSSSDARADVPSIRTRASHSHFTADTPSSIRVGDVASHFPWRGEPSRGTTGARTVKNSDSVTAPLASTGVRSLVLASNNLRARGCVAIAAAMTGESSLESLDLAANRVGVEGANALSSLLSHPGCAVRVLNLQDNRLGSKGVAKLLPVRRSQAGCGIDTQMFTVLACRVCWLASRWNRCTSEGTL